MNDLNELNGLIKAQAIIERARVSANNQRSHLSGDGLVAATLTEVAQTLQGLEGRVEKTMHEVVKDHPAWPWLQSVKGVGPQTACLMLGYLLPPRSDKGPSSWYKAAGLYVVEVDGESRLNRADHLPPGEKITWHPRLRRNLFIMADCLIRARGFYYDLYVEAKKALQIKHPDWKGRCHAVARWKMVKIFLAHLYQIWADAIGVEVRPPYPLEILGHRIIEPPRIA